MKFALALAAAALLAAAPAAAQKHPDVIVVPYSGKPIPEQPPARSPDDMRQRDAIFETECIPKNECMKVFRAVALGKGTCTEQKTVKSLTDHMALGRLGPEGVALLVDLSQGKARICPR